LDGIYGASVTEFAGSFASEYFSTQIVLDPVSERGIELAANEATQHVARNTSALLSRQELLRSDIIDKPVKSSAELQRKKTERALKEEKELKKEFNSFLAEQKWPETVKELNKLAREKKEILGKYAQASEELKDLVEARNLGFWGRIGNGYFLYTNKALDKLIVDQEEVCSDLKTYVRECMQERALILSEWDVKIKIAFGRKDYELRYDNRREIPYPVKHVAIPEKFVGKLIRFSTFCDSLAKYVSLDNLDREPVNGGIVIKRADGAMLRIKGVQPGKVEIYLTQAGETKEVKVGLVWNRVRDSDQEERVLGVCRKFIEGIDLEELIVRDRKSYGRYVIPEIGSDHRVFRK
jgi:hypothetical protein